MKMTNSKHCVYCLSIVIATLICVGISCRSQTKNAWYKVAEEYIEYDNLMFENRIKDPQKGIEFLKIREACRKTLINSKRPYENELKILLVSKNMLDKKVALVYCALRGVHRIELYKYVFDILATSPDMQLRFYSYLAINNLTENDIVRYQDDFLNILSKEDIDALVIKALPILKKIDSPKVVDFFMKYLTHDSKMIQVAAQNYVKDIDKDYQKEINNRMSTYRKKKGTTFNN